MNASLLSTLVVSVFLVFVILGFVFGWFRGLSKSLTRFIMVLGVAVLSYFVIPPITKALLELDISKFNLVIGDVHVVTVKDLVTDLLRQIPIVEDLIESSPTLEAFIEVLPTMISNVLLFIVFFFVFKWVSMIIYWIISAIFFSKKKRAGKEKHGFIGAVVGAIQGVVVACVILVPCFGMVATIEPFVESNQTVQQPAGQNFIDGVYYVDGEQPEDGGEITIDKAITGLARYTKAFEENWVVKMLSAIKIKDLSVKMYQELSTVESNGVEYSLLRETETIAKAYPELKPILDNGFDIEDNEQLESIKETINILYESPVLSGMVQEIIPEAADKWSNGYKFCEIEKPEFNDEGLDALFNAILVNLSVAKDDTIKNDVITGVDMLKIANDADLLRSIANDGDIMEVLLDEGNENLIADIVGKALESDTLKAVLPKVMDVALDFVYRGLGIDPENVSDINVTSDQIQDWGVEKAKLQGIFTNLVKVADNITKGLEADNTKSPLDFLDFGALGAVLDNMRASELLGAVSKNVMTAILNSQSIVGDSDKLTPFISSLTSDEVWANPTVSLEKTFISIGEAIELAKNLKESTEAITPENVGNILEGLTDSGALKDVVKDIATTETLKDLGLTEETAGVVSDIVTSIVDAEYSEESGNVLDNEIAAVTEVFEIANKVVNGDGGQAEVSPTEAEDLVGALANSTVLLDSISSIEGGNSNVSNMVKNGLTTEALGHISGEISKVEDEETRNKLKALFGL